MDMRGPMNALFERGKVFNDEVRDVSTPPAEFAPAVTSDDVAFVEIPRLRRVRPTTPVGRTGRPTTAPLPAAAPSSTPADPVPISSSSVSSARRSAPSVTPPPVQRPAVSRVPRSTSSSGRVRRPPSLFDPDRSAKDSQATYPLQSRWAAHTSGNDAALVARHAILHEEHEQTAVDFNWYCENEAHALAAADVPVHVCAPDAATFDGDPVSWKAILAMSPADNQRYKEATIDELNGLKDKCIELVLKDSIPACETVY